MPRRSVTRTGSVSSGCASSQVTGSAGTAWVEKQVIIVFTGALEVRLNNADAAVELGVGTGEVFSVPGDAWRRLAAVGDTAVEAALITAGDARKRITWAPEIVQAATAAGFGLDHDGHVAPLALLPPPTREAVLARMQAAA